MVHIDREEIDDYFDGFPVRRIPTAELVRRGVLAKGTFNWYPIMTKPSSPEETLQGEIKALSQQVVAAEGMSGVAGRLNNQVDALILEVERLNAVARPLPMPPVGTELPL